jgi:hypothetical protein
MTMTALNVLLNDIDKTLEDENNPMMNEERRLMLRVIKFFVEDNELLQLEKNQIIEAALNFTNSKEEAEKYYHATYGE